MGLDHSGVLTVGTLVPKEGRHTVLHNTLLVIPCPGCALQSHAYGYQREPDGRLSGLQPPSGCVPC